MKKISITWQNDEINIFVCRAKVPTEERPKATLENKHKTLISIDAQRRASAYDENENIAGR